MKNIRLWGVAAIGILLSGGIWHASQHRPTGPSDGVEIQGVEFLRKDASRDAPVPGDKAGIGDNAVYRPIRVGTFNLHGCRGEDKIIDIMRSAKCLEKLDFAALEEVHGAQFFGGEDQAALLGKQLKMAWLFAPAVREWYCLDSGNGFLTTLPVTFWQRIPLQSHRDYSFRNVILLGLRQKGSGGQERIINTLVTHVNRRYDEDREAQLRAVIALFLSLREPAILLGDLNSDSKDPQIAQLLHNNEIIDSVGKILGSNDDPKRIDWIFCRGMKPVDAGILENHASDHSMVWVELE
jgi:endonuclease/exonuclease/phosphatase family metal-dependent hydrolase